MEPFSAHLLAAGPGNDALEQVDKISMLGLTRRANVQRLFEVAYRFHLDCYAALGQNPGADLIRTPHRRSSGDKGPRLARKLHNKDGCVAQLCNLEAMLGEPLGKQPGPTMPIYINVFPPNGLD